MKKVLIVFGTRPEAIKCFPVVTALRKHASVNVEVCVTAQHREMLDQVLDVAGLQPDMDLNLMKPDQTLPGLTAAAVSQLSEVISNVRPDWLLVQGDTTTAMSAALAAFYNRVPVGHIEAGLRSGNIYSPWPEEVNRKMVSAITTLHFAPTQGARDNLLRENVPDGHILVTGNTVIDALLLTQRRLETGDDFNKHLANLPVLDPDKKLILVTAHRRENFDGGLHQIFNALTALAQRSDVQIVFPVHPNPNVRSAAQRLLVGVPNIWLIEPQEYVPFVWLMGRSHIILTDSGGVQEEAPSLGKPVLVLRDTTERPEGVAAGTARLIGTDTAAIIASAEELLDDECAWLKMQKAKNPYGDGRAAERIAEAIVNA
jgi:UDP-N-acetylglucosamine 2-epimerase (non-hydrolysing)